MIEKRRRKDVFVKMHPPSPSWMKFLSTSRVPWLVTKMAYGPISAVVWHWKFVTVENGMKKLTLIFMNY